MKSVESILSQQPPDLIETQLQNTKCSLQIQSSWNERVQCSILPPLTSDHLAWGGMLGLGLGHARQPGGKKGAPYPNSTPYTPPK